MKNGIIYPPVKFIIDKLYWFNLVELFKEVGLLINPDKANKEKEITYSRVATDIFILLKWLFIILIWHFEVTNALIIIFVKYLIVSNVFTYFYYHIWINEAISTINFSEDRIRRRFVNLLLAIGYSDFCFAFLYQVPYHLYFNWTGIQLPSKAIWFSISNSLAANYSVVSPDLDFAYGNSLSMIQLIITFVFVTIIISRSIPQKD